MKLGMSAGNLWYLVYKRPRLFLGSKGVDLTSSNIVVENFALLRYIMEVDNLTSYLFIILTNSLVSF